MHLALVLDRSGSMSGEPIERLREAAALLLRRLWPEDRVSVVAYDNEVLTLADAVSGDRHAEAATGVGRLFARGSTNLSGGWLRGRDLVEKALVPAGVNRIVLMTDGLANQGITDPGRLGELCRSAAAAGITTTTIGFGPNFNEDLLRLMADAGGGATYYVERPDQAPGIFEEGVEGLLSLAAQNVSVEVEAGKGASLVAVRHTYPSSTRGGVVRLEVGDLYATEPRLEDEGQWDLAGQVLGSVARSLEASGDEVAAHEARELREAALCVAERSLGPADVKYMKQRAHDSRRSRMKAREKYRREP